MTKKENYKLEIINELRKLGFDILEEYTTTRTPIKLKCKCGKIFKSSVANILNGRKNPVDVLKLTILQSYLG